MMGNLLQGWIKKGVKISSLDSMLESKKKAQVLQQRVDEIKQIKAELEAEEKRLVSEIEEANIKAHQELDNIYIGSNQSTETPVAHNSYDSNTQGIEDYQDKEPMTVSDMIQEGINDEVDNSKKDISENMIIDEMEDIIIPQSIASQNNIKQDFIAQNEFHENEFHQQLSHEQKVEVFRRFVHE